MRHNNIRDVEASFLREVCRDVKVEPGLLPLGNTGTQSRNIADKGRLDVSAIGIWRMEPHGKSVFGRSCYTPKLTIVS